MSIAAFFTQAKIQKQPKCSSMDEWIKKMCIHTHTYTHTYVYTHTHMKQYYLATKKKEILLFVTMCVDTEGIMLSEISQTEKDKYHTISLICGV